jgi:hypothetical protein
MVIIPTSFNARYLLVKLASFYWLELQVFPAFFKSTLSTVIAAALRKQKLPKIESYHILNLG